MQQLNWFTSLLTALEMLSLAAVVFIMIWRRQWSRWPSLLTVLSLELATDIACMLLMHYQGHYMAYFRTYWISEAFQAVLRIWVIADIIRNFPAIEILPSTVYLFVGVASGTMAAASAVYCYHSHPHVADGQIQNLAVMLDSCVSIAWSTFIAVVLMSIKVINLGWDPYQARMANGFFIRIIVGLVVAELLGVDSHTKRIFANVLAQIASIAVLLYWIDVITKQKPSPGAGVWDDAQASTCKPEALLTP
jgi:hypothetical protein